MKKVILIVVAVVAVVLIGVASVSGSRNKAISYEEMVTTAQSDIQVQLKRRADLIPNLADCVKQYDKHEYETLMATINARNMSNDSDVDEVEKLINVTAEAYPELKSSENYNSLMTELATTENLIAQQRKAYNTTVTEYNKYVRSFPASMFLSMSGYEAVDFEKLTFDVSEDAPTNLFD